MREMRLRLQDFLEHILQAIERIERYTADTDETTFLQNELTQDAVVRNIEIIGQASHNIEARFPEFAAAHPELPLSFAYQMRNAVAHGYFTVDMAILWRTIRDDLPRLRTQVNKAIEALKRETQN